MLDAYYLATERAPEIRLFATRIELLFAKQLFVAILIFLANLPEEIMKSAKLIITLLTFIFASMPVLAHNPKGESFSLSGKITSITLSDQGGVINVSAEAGRYGKVFLTYNVTINPAVPNQGSFHGNGVGFNDEGVREGGSRQGVFRRDGTTMQFYSLDDVSDGELNYCETLIDLKKETVEMTFYPL